MTKIRASRSGSQFMMVVHRERTAGTIVLVAAMAFAIVMLRRHLHSVITFTVTRMGYQQMSRGKTPRKHQ